MIASAMLSVSIVAATYATAQTVYHYRVPVPALKAVPSTGQPSGPTPGPGSGGGGTTTPPVPAWSMSLLPSAPTTAYQGGPYAFDASEQLRFTGESQYAGSGVQWSLAQGALPLGLSLSPSGIVQGTPHTESVGTPFTLQAAYRGKTAQQQYLIEVPPIQMALSPNTPAKGLIGTSYSADLTSLLQVQNDSSFNGSGVSWQVVQGSLAPGLGLSASGVVSGTPTSASTGAVQVQAAYKGKTVQQSFDFAVDPIQIQSSVAGPLPQASIGTAYSTDLKTWIWASGDGNYDPALITWNLKTGSVLSPGLSLNSATGVISGTPEGKQVDSFTVRVAYKSAVREFELQVPVAPLEVKMATESVTWATYVGTSSSSNIRTYLRVTGDPTYKYTGASWEVTGGQLPPGMTLESATGNFTGAPTMGGSYSAQVTATYKGYPATITVNLNTKHTVQLQSDGARTWSDGTIASSCNAYRQTPESSNYNYRGAAGSGNYRISAGGLNTVVWCDMTTYANAGITVIAVLNDHRVANASYTQAAANSPPTPGGTHGSYLPLQVVQALAAPAVQIHIREYGTSNTMWSNNSTVLGNLRAGRALNYHNASYATSHNSYWNQSTTNLTNLDFSCPVTVNYPTILWACGNNNGIHLAATGTDGRSALATWRYQTYNSNSFVVGVL